jgi:hypothetical protein
MAALAQELESLHELELESELEGEGELESEFEAVNEGEGGSEFETELEGEGELESEISPVRKIYADGMMEHLAHMAAEAESEQEAAEHFLPLVGLAAKKLLPVVAKAAAPALRKALPQVARAVTRVEPQLTRGITKIVRGLHRSPETRRLLHAIPSIARRTLHSVARQAAQGRPITPRTAVRMLAQQTRRVLAHGPNRIQALRRSRWMDRRFHRNVAPGTLRTHMPSSAARWPGYTQYAGQVPAGVRASYVTGPGAAVYPPCPRCDGVAGAAPTPAYCRCCGQLLR